MIGQIVYISNEKSIKQSIESYESFNNFGWDISRVEGITPDTLNEKDFDFLDVPNGRLESFKINEPKKYPIKKSCLFNNLKFCEKVIEADKPLAFLEHDSICISKWLNYDFEDYCFLSFEYAFKPPTALAKHPFNKYETKSTNGINDFPLDYPLKYYKDTLYKGSIMTPGTSAYALTPNGAKKILYAVEKYGLEQSDFIINSTNVRMQYVYPSPVKFNVINLKSSHGIIQ